MARTLGHAPASSRPLGPAAAAGTEVFPRNWRAGLDLKVDDYSAERRDDIEAAIKTVLSTTPVPTPSPSPALYEPLAQRRQLPASAPAMFALCGKPQSGKDVVADYVQAHYAGVERMAFSDTILDEANAYLAGFVYDITDAEGRLVAQRSHRIVEANKSLPYYRHLLQAWGMARREEDAPYWTYAVGRKIRALRAAGAAATIVTGPRLETDVAVIHEHDGPVWRVVRPGNPYQAAHAVESGLDHLPEDTFVTIYNPVEGALGPYEANIEATLRGRPQPFPPGALDRYPSRAAAVLAFIDSAAAVVADS